MLGVPESEGIVRIDGEPLGSGIPIQLIKRAAWIEWPDEEGEEDDDIRVIDVGEAFSQNAVPEKLAQPDELRASETIFTGTIDHRVDLWSVGCIVRFPALHPCECQCSFTHRCL